MGILQVFRYMFECCKCGICRDILGTYIQTDNIQKVSYNIDVVSYKVFHEEEAILMWLVMEMLL